MVWFGEQWMNFDAIEAVFLHSGVRNRIGSASVYALDFASH